MVGLYSALHVVTTRPLHAFALTWPTGEGWGNMVTIALLEKVGVIWSLLLSWRRVGVLFLYFRRVG